MSTTAENWATVARPAVSGGTLATTLAARSITTYVLDPRDQGRTALTGALVGRQSGRCLTADASGAAIASCTGAAGQSWSYDADGTLKGANGCLTAGSSGLTATATATATGDGTRRWLLNADRQIVNEASGRCLDVGGQATADGRKVILYSCNGGANEAWTRR
ncbi:RICIN domain-containing protein [Streptomyces sp. NPDC001817]|uniref:RICIN domain-containing protein n=1 Tax=Streptomyces sp. NPDC001817 TaxID=3154398 RepID=UPI003316F02D